jgi:hypothetical protein
MRSRYAEDCLAESLTRAASLNLQVYPVNTQVAPHDNEWIVKRRDSQFLWSLQP